MKLPFRYISQFTFISAGNGSLVCLSLTNSICIASAKLFYVKPPTVDTHTPKETYTPDVANMLMVAQALL